MINKRMENSVRSLVSLYTVVIGVALSLAVVTLVDGGDGLDGVNLSKCLLFVAFIATLFPFYHGALRHLDDAYIENPTGHIRDGALVFDFMLLFLHALVFVVLALLLAKPGPFAWVLTVLISVDVIWGVFAYFGSSSRTADGTKKPLSAEAKWTGINFGFAGLLGCYLVLADVGLGDVQQSLKMSVLIAFACVARTVCDYAWCSHFYFPKN